MTDDFKAGVDWFLTLQNLFPKAETRLIWTLLKADGAVVSSRDLERAVIGRDHVESNVLNVHISRTRVRARGLGLDIKTVHGVGYKIEVGPESMFWAGAKAA